jgi:2'-5' RNA ligase
MADRRLFLALWPDAVARQALLDASAQLHAALGGRRMHQAGLHLTLAFLGDMDALQLEALQRAMALVTMGDVVLRFDSFGWWKPGIAWLGMTQQDSRLEALVQRLRDALDAASVRYDRKRFKAHVTLLRDARQAPLPKLEAPIEWHCSAFDLVESAGGPYRSLATFPVGR